MRGGVRRVAQPQGSRTAKSLPPKLTSDSPDEETTVGRHSSGLCEHWLIYQVANDNAKQS